MSQAVIFRPTTKEELRNLMRKIQEGMDIYLKLPKRKQRKRKNRDAYSDLVLLGRMILRGYHHQMKIGNIQNWESTISSRSKLLSKSLG